MIGSPAVHVYERSIPARAAVLVQIDTHLFSKALMPVMDATSQTCCLRRDSRRQRTT